MDDNGSSMGNAESSMGKFVQDVGKLVQDTTTSNINMTGSVSENSSKLNTSQNMQNESSEAPIRNGTSQDKRNESSEAPSKMTTSQNWRSERLEPSGKKELSQKWRNENLANPKETDTSQNWRNEGSETLSKMESSHDMRIDSMKALRKTESSQNWRNESTKVSTQDSPAEVLPPETPSRTVKPVSTQTPRLKKKVPWKGKSIVVHLPRDEQRGKPGKGVMPLRPGAVTSMLRSWEQLGYDIRGFDLRSPATPLDPLENCAQSCNQWPNPDDILKERSLHKYQVTLPDLNAWKNYVKELQEAKLRALGVSFGDEDPAPPSISPAPSSLSRQASAQYPPLPFSPPNPTSSAASVGPQGFPVPGAFHGASATQSPTVPSVASPINPPLPPGPGKINHRASVSVMPNELPFHFSGLPSPHGWSPQQMLLQQQLSRGSSPSILNLNSIVSPTSPFQPPEKMSSPLGIHQRHQSLQFPMLPHQQLQRRESARASPRLQELREAEEETQSNPYENSPSKSPEPGQFIKHNASASLQKEIDDAEYHLEEQFREQLEHEDYSPHNEGEKAAASQPVEPAKVPLPVHNRGPSVHFANFATDSGDGLVLHHPRPHSRGHSLSQKPFFDNDEVRDNTDEGSASKPLVTRYPKGDESFETETNPSNLGTPVGSFNMVNNLHDRSFSTVSNPWANAESFNTKAPSRRTSHNSKPSLSKLNAGASEFKFSPTNTFTPGQFNFGATSAFQPTASTFQPAAFQASTFMSNAPQSATSSHFSVASTSSSKTKIKPTAPVFSPGNSEFSFTGKNDFNFAAPKFNPEASAFQPLGSLAGSVTSGNDSASNQPGSIFSNIDLTLSDVIRPKKKSKAVTIVRPPSRHTPTEDALAIEETDQDGRLTDASRRSKKFRETIDDGDNVSRFAEPTPEPELPMASQSKLMHEKNEVAANEKPEDENETIAIGDATMASTVISESTDGKLRSESTTKTTTSPSATSPDQDKANWTSSEFSKESEVRDFNNARPFGDDEPSFKKAHKKSLSASAKPFIPGGFTFGSETTAESSFEPVLKTQPPPMVEPEESKDDCAASATPGPEPRPVADHELEIVAKSSPEPVSKAPARSGLGMSRFAFPPPSARGLGASRFASSPPKPAGLAASSFAVSPNSGPGDEAADDPGNDVAEAGELPELRSFKDSIPLPVSPPSVREGEQVNDDNREPTFEEIDAVMKHLNEKDPTMGVRRTVSPAPWHKPSPVHHPNLLTAAIASPMHLAPQSQSRSDSPSPSPRRASPPEPAQILSTKLEDPFLDPSQSAIAQNLEGSVYRLNIGDDLPESEWDDAFSTSEQAKLEQRVTYFDGRVNEVLGNVLASRLDPLEKTLDSIQHVLASLSRRTPTLSHRTPSTRRNRRSVSAEIPESDADDEDDEMPPARRSMSPRKDKRMEQIRFAVMEAMNQHQASRALQTAVEQTEQTEQISAAENAAILEALNLMKEELGQNLRLDSRADDLRAIVEEAVQKRVPPAPLPQAVKDDKEATRAMSDMQNKIFELQKRLSSEEEKEHTKVIELQQRLKLEEDRGQSKIAELEQRLKAEEEKVENEITIRRGAEDNAAELGRRLDQAETKVEVEIMNRSIYDQRIHDLEERLKLQEDRAELELHGRREAEDRLSEIQRLLRISSEEEDRLRSVVDERDHKIKTIEQKAGHDNMRLALLEAEQTNSDKMHVDLTNRLNASDEEIRVTRNEARHWRSEVEHARESARRQTDDFVQAIEESKHLRKVIDTLGTQLEETERIRDTWREKFASMQNDMVNAAREITEENSRRTKKEQTLIARQEVLDARLQAESRTRERLEAELERLECGERDGMRAVSECKRLDGLIGGLKNENHKLHQNVLHFKREYEEARESAAAEVRRARTSVQGELETANVQVNIVRAELEEELSKVRAQLDQVRMDADTAKVHHEMMLEEAQNSKTSDLEEFARKHQNEIEDLLARHERQINNATEDAQRAEQNLLERLSLSTSKTEHLQDRVAHLEDKLQNAQAVKSAGATEPAAQAAAVAKPATVTQAMQLPEKISPQALRESIMVLQEQLQAREQRIEELEQTVAKLDPEAPTKISKRDDEIIWLRELLAVRHGDLQDIISALSAEDLDKEAVKEAAIRLNANLQMEEQERERAMNGGSAINMPNIAATIRGAATPRVAQAVGPLAAAWGNWRKANQPTLNNISSVLSSPAPARNATPSKASPSFAEQSSLFSGLMTPPASGLRNSSPPDQAKSQPTAFGNTGRWYTAEQFANRSRGSLTPRQAEKMSMAGSTPPRQGSDRREPVTPPMMRSGGYDDDASHIDDFDDAGYFDD